MIPIFKPSMGKEEILAITEVIKSNWLGLGPKTEEFERLFADYLGVKYAVAVNSATSALHLGLKIFDIPGKEIITTPITFISTNHAILYNNCVPVFCDIEPDTLNINPALIENLITPDTGAIMLVHYGGYSVDMDKIMSIASKYNLKVIEDTAHGCGGEYKTRKLGSIGDVGCFSFHAVKNLAVGDGGMITTNNKDYYERLTKLRWLGINKNTWTRTDNENNKYSWYYDIDELGYKYHINDIASALGLVQLKKLDDLNYKRFQIVQKYNDAFKDVDEIETPVKKEYMTKPAYHNYVIKIDDRDKLNEFLKHKGISTGVHYYPNNHYKMYKKYRNDTPVSDKIWKKILTLPLYPDLTDNETDYIIKSVKEYFNWEK